VKGALCVATGFCLPLGSNLKVAGNEDNDVGAGRIFFGAKMVPKFKVKVPSDIVQH
jgi:hypothetical protein